MFNIIERHNTLTEEQCAYLIEHNAHGLQPSTVSDIGTKSLIPKLRSSFSYKLPSIRADIAEKLLSVITETTGVSEDRIEPWELLYYEKGGYFRSHKDWFDPDIHKDLYAQGGQRTHSAIVYLADVEQGGETFFPLIRRMITPQRGLFIAWNNVHNGNNLYLSTHEGRPVVAGEKWALVTWVREHAVK